MVIFNKSIKGGTINLKVRTTLNVLLDRNPRGKLRKRLIFEEKIELNRPKPKKIDQSFITEAGRPL